MFYGTVPRSLINVSDRDRVSLTVSNATVQYITVLTMLTIADV
jgi:hypothetical protein